MASLGSSRIVSLLVFSIVVLLTWPTTVLVTNATESETMGCPLPCQCTTGKVDCNLAGLLEWPADLPSNTTTLILSRNHLQSLPNAAQLGRYPSLKTLVLSYNRIQYDGRGERLGHDQLENLDLSHNSISDLSFLPDLPKLRHLNVAFNQLGSGPSQPGNDTFAHNVRLQWLSLNGNPITALESGLFRRNEFLGYLSLSGLEVETLPNRLLDPLTRLQQLEIRDNHRLTELREDVFRFLGGSLRHLNLANNSLTTLPRSLRQLDALRVLNLDDNPFECHCHLFWFANWLEKRPSVVPSANMYCSDSRSGRRPLVESLWRMHCSAVRLETSTLFQHGLFGEPVVMTCNFSGNPAPSVTWVMPDRTTLRYGDNDAQSVNRSNVRLLSSGQLEVSYLDRNTAGDYACHASNALSNVTAFMRVHIEPRGFRRVQIQSIMAGFGAVGAFVLIAVIVQGFRYLMDKYVSGFSFLTDRILSVNLTTGSAGGNAATAAANASLPGLNRSAPC